MDCLIPDWLYIMSDTPAMPDLQLHLKPPALNWDGNLHETFKSFRIRATVLLDGPYARYDDKDKVAALLSWMGDKGFHLYESIEWVDYNKELWSDVLKAFESHFKPCQTVMQSWYQLGSLYSSNCEDQTEFMTRIKELVNEGSFTQKDEVTKFLFVIHNTDPKVREYLIDKGDPKKTCSDFLNLARSVESMVQTETMSKQLLQNVGKLSISAVQNRTQAGQRQRSSSRQSNKRADSQNRSSSGQPASSGRCGRCGRNHAPRRCPAFRQNCRRCGVKGHYAKCCKSKNPNNQGCFKGKRFWIDVRWCFTDRGMLNPNHVLEIFSEYSGQTPTELRSTVLKIVEDDLALWDHAGTVFLRMKFMLLDEWIKVMKLDITPCDELMIYILNRIHCWHTVIYTKNRSWSTVRSNNPLDSDDLHSICDLHLVYLGGYIFGELRRLPMTPAPPSRLPPLPITKTTSTRHKYPDKPIDLAVVTTREAENDCPACPSSPIEFGSKKPVQENPELLSAALTRRSVCLNSSNPQRPRNMQRADENMEIYRNYVQSRTTNEETKRKSVSDFSDIELLQDLEYGVCHNDQKDVSVNFREDEPNVMASTLSPPVRLNHSNHLPTNRTTPASRTKDSALNIDADPSSLTVTVNEDSEQNETSNAESLKKTDESLTHGCLNSSSHDAKVSYGTPVKLHTIVKEYLTVILTEPVVQRLMIDQRHYPTRLERGALLELAVHPIQDPPSSHVADETVEPQHPVQTEPLLFNLSDYLKDLATTRPVTVCVSRLKKEVVQHWEKSHWSYIDPYSDLEEEFSDVPEKENKIEKKQREPKNVTVTECKEYNLHTRKRSYLSKRVRRQSTITTFYRDQCGSPMRKIRRGKRTPRISTAPSDDQLKAQERITKNKSGLSDAEKLIRSYPLFLNKDEPPQTEEETEANTDDQINDYSDDKVIIDNVSHEETTTKTEDTSIVKCEFKKKLFGIKKKTKSCRIRNYYCTNCEEVFTQLSKLNEHFKQNHPPLKCKVCSEFFNMPSTLTRHSYKHRSCDYECPQCDKKFPFESDRDTHLVKHRTIKGHTCIRPNCWKSFFFEGDLTKHVKTHSKVTWDCKMCDYTSKDERNLKAHMRSHSALKRYLCETCCTLFKYDMQLRHHRPCKGTQPDLKKGNRSSSPEF